jgi:radical SAM protein with 4Fe4S-binding SPASM domain
VKDYTDYIYFHVKGEPLLHPHIDELLDICHDKGFQVNITTNGTQIQRVRDRLIPKPALRQINFSLHSFDGNEGVTDKAEYINHILSFIEEATDRTEMIIALRLWNLEENNEANQEKKRNNELLTMIERKFDLPFLIQEKVTPGRGIRIGERIFLNQDYQFKWPDLKEIEDDGNGFCYGLRNQIAILVDGTVVPCCLDGEGVIALGNIKDESFREIINGERATNIVDGFSRREAVEELCRKCGYRKRFS